MENDLLVQPIKIITKFDITIMIQRDPTKQIASTTRTSNNQRAAIYIAYISRCSE
jgi:hypothetical protein